MDVYSEEFIDFWSALNKNNVEYLMVGGVATNLNGYQRTTDDIDILIRNQDWVLAPGDSLRFSRLHFSAKNQPVIPRAYRYYKPYIYL